MEVSIDRIARIIGAEIIGDGSLVISGISSFDDAESHHITFAGESSFLGRLDSSRAGAVIVPRSVTKESQTTLLRVDHPKLSFFKVVEIFHPPQKKRPYISPSAVVGENVSLGKKVTLDPNVVIEDDAVIGDHVHLMPHVFIGRGARIGDHTTIKPNVTVMDGTRIGSHTLIHSGSVIGSDGYGFAQGAGVHEKFPHTGIVEIGDHVEIGACNTIDRGTLGITRIGSGVKTDNQVHIAHNVKIGENTLIVAQVGIAGSTQVGKNVIIAGKAGVSGHLTIGDNSIVGPYAGVSADVPEGEIVSGIPHMPHKTWLKAVNIIPRLPGMRKKLLALEKRLKSLENQDVV
ncbi:UDP-3-O-(3-hydroxymyristoyl)glucosamine N-acyltransferase [Desulfospira joergensenii]|uniref:UDP-3-O-(3-hydroxymyristoyl)glucosamine N-acyltransferase n=1 Tax=Desulfospira joergensenii TaxID=53329 RepID=UPI0003B53EEB|nr:UDP-3-O-(3-hydroxymyristoyl)glucosamine N-acyltransferase [Desulfospira joergensenii]